MHRTHARFVHSPREPPPDGLSQHASLEAAAHQQPEPAKALGRAHQPAAAGEDCSASRHCDTMFVCELVLSESICACVMQLVIEGHLPDPEWKPSRLWTDDYLKSTAVCADASYIYQPQHPVETSRANLAMHIKTHSQPC